MQNMPIFDGGEMEGAFISPIFRFFLPGSSSSSSLSAPLVRLASPLLPNPLREVSTWRVGGGGEVTVAYCFFARRVLASSPPRSSARLRGLASARGGGGGTLLPSFARRRERMVRGVGKGRRSSTTSSPPPPPLLLFCVFAFASGWRRGEEESSKRERGGRGGKVVNLNYWVVKSNATKRGKFLFFPFPSPPFVRVLADSTVWDFYIQISEGGGRHPLRFVNEIVPQNLTAASKEGCGDRGGSGGVTRLLTGNGGGSGER